MTAVSFDFDEEAGRGCVEFVTTRMDCEDRWSLRAVDGVLRVCLSTEECVELFRGLRHHLGGYVREMEEAHAAVRARMPLDVFMAEGNTSANLGSGDDEDAYDVSDPKHPGFVDYVADWADDQRKRVREGGA